MEKYQEKVNKIIDRNKLKLSIYYNSSTVPLIQNNKDPIPKLLSNFSEIKEIIKLKDSKILKLFYLNFKNIHDILYEDDEIINLSSNSFNKENLSCYFYLNLLILTDANLVNYEYSIDFISDLNNIIVGNKKNLKKIIKAKLILDLLNNYKKTDFFKENESNSFLEDGNNKLLKENIHIFDEFKNLERDKDNIRTKKIDEIYIIIIKSLIINKKLEDYGYSSNILEQLDLESIYLTQNMLKQLFDLLNINNDYIKFYLITKTEDLFNIKKINFYYILLKYILKHSLYIYVFPFLLKTKQKILQIVKYNLEELFSFIDNIEGSDIIKRIEYILEFISDSKYYFLKYTRLIKNKLKEIVNYYKGFLFNSKKEDIKVIEREIKSDSPKDCEKYLIDFKKAEKINKRTPIIKYLFNNSNTLKSENELNENLKCWESIEKNIIENSFERIDQLYIDILYSYFTDRNNKESLLKIFDPNTIDNTIKFLEEETKFESQILNSSEKSEIKIYSDIYQSSSEEKEEKIHANSISYLKRQTKSISFPLKITSFQNTNSRIDNKENIHFDFVSFLKIINKLENPKDKVRKIDIPENQKDKKILENPKHKTAECIKEMSTGHFVSIGKNDNLCVYNNDFSLIYHSDKKECDKWKYSICERKVVGKTCDEFIIYEEDICYIYQIKRDNVLKKNCFDANNFSFCIKIINSNIIKTFVYGKRGLSFEDKSFHETLLDECEYITEEPIYGGIIIDENYVGFISRNTEKKNNKLFFFNLLNKKIDNEEKINYSYSFNCSQNNLILLERKDDTNKKVLLCACKKYTRSENNGIVLANFCLEEKNSYIRTKFYDTEKFEVYCFCQLSINKNNIKAIFNSNYQFEKTDYFLVGGFDTKKGRGMIKLYILIYNYDEENNNDVSIEFVETDIFKSAKNREFNGFKGPVSCIIQSKRNGDIIVCCWDGNIYHFTIPNINSFISLMDKDNINKILK